MTDNEELLQILKDRGPLGLNSFDPYRNNHIQLPRMISDLEKSGHKIEHREEKNTSVTYILRNTSQGGSDSLSAPMSPSLQDGHFCGDTYRFYLEAECRYCRPVQEVLV